MANKALDGGVDFPELTKNQENIQKQGPVNKAVDSQCDQGTIKIGEIVGGVQIGFTTKYPSDGEEDDDVGLGELQKRFPYLG